ncbi:MAG TPA: argininosuccinate lyase [Candidatus Omnitrophica bacterium]|nr:MAG: argininosuccinate lyase [Omnitrophica WOR_2 bacterium GWA2_45_18]OGX20651.1 MAG: argininosuccinate lyase [Omnitrophica WOR_2 bacterium GWC2_45_7]HBR15449.1 argininosuccinate lyase [Candidatus Omnitrophota bacterium]
MSKLWGGRFSKKTHTLVEEFSKSIHFDHKLAKYDCIGSLIHIDILKKANLLTSAEHKKLKTGLKKILAEMETGDFIIQPEFEDIHSYIQHVLEQKAGKSALKLHTCRSRNDQVVFDTKLYSLDNISHLKKLIVNFCRVLTNLSSQNKNLIIPGFTHLQHAMPVKLSDYFLAFVEMLKRDDKRLSFIFNNINLTMGSGALAGTFIDASKYQKTHIAHLPDLPFDLKPTENSLDTVSDRDFVIEILSTLSIVGMHLSRLAEEMILWATKEFDFIDIDDAFCTGSSLMPQKKNPDVLELVRGYSGRLYGNLINVLVMMKGLPLTYNRDMQHDKEPLFDSFEIIQNELNILTELFKNIRFKKENIRKQIMDEALYATDIADHLVKNGIPFKEAHAIIGRLMQLKYSSRQAILDMQDKTLKEIHPLLTSKVIRAIVDPATSVLSKKSIKNRKVSKRNA